jgi:hypothetical protein
MYNACAYIYARKDKLMECMASVYSFLDKNNWFKGEVIINSENDIFSKEWKNIMTSLYSKLYFVENETVDSLFEKYNYGLIVKLNDNTLFINSICDEIVKTDKIFDIANIDESFKIEALAVNTDNYFDKKTIIFTDGEDINNSYVKTIVDGCVSEILFSGPVYRFSTFETTTTFPKSFNDRFKYVVCVCARNENKYIVEWIEHYLNLGFDKIFICDNNADGDNSLYETIEQYVLNGSVEIFDCRKLNCFQVQFYSMFCTEGNYEWCGYFDCDEFLEIPSYFDVKHYLSTKSDELCVSFHWMVYGSNGKMHSEEGLLKDRFKLPSSPVAMFTENCFVKSIVKGSGVFNKGCWFNGSHIPVTTPMYSHNVGGHFITNSDRHCYFPPKYKDGYIRHYYTKSFEEWINKSGRGWPDGTDTLYLDRYFVCEDWVTLPLKQMTRGLFSEYGGSNETKQYYVDMLKNYDVISINNTTQNIYGLIIGMYNLMQSVTDYVFILGEEHIDDTVFNMVLEYGLQTGNKVVWAESLEDKLNVVQKYSKISDTYFILNLD